MPRLCYDFPLDAPTFLALGELVTRLRAAVVSVLSVGLGAVAAGGCRMLDSRSSVVSVIGGALVLGVALVVDGVRKTSAPVQELHGTAEELARLRARVEELEVQMQVAHVKIDGSARKSFADRSAERTGNPPSMR